MGCVVMKEFENRNYLVVGATSGIGKSVCTMLADCNANVILMARTDETLQDMRDSLPSGHHAAISCDVTSLKNIEPAVGKIKGQYERIDGLVWCVGLGKTGRLRDLKIDDMFQAFGGSCFAFLETVKILMSGKPKTQALRIVAISSLASSEFQKYLTLYSASKAALEASIRCLAAELGPRNTRINAIRPAFVDTPRLYGLNEITGNVEASLKNSGYQPLGLIDAADVAKITLFLLSDSASHINGVSWAINGGASC